MPHHKILLGDVFNQMPLMLFERKLLWIQKNQREKSLAPAINLNPLWMLVLFTHTILIYFQIQAQADCWDFRFVFSKAMNRNLFCLIAMFHTGCSFLSLS